MNKSNLFKSVLVLFFVGFSTFQISCAKKSSNDNNRAEIAPRGTGTIGATGTSATTNALAATKCTDGSSTWGRLYDDGSMGGLSFRNSYADFLSASSNPEQVLGSLDGSPNSTTTGVNFNLKLKIVNNQLDLNQTTLLIEITDDKVGKVDENGNTMKLISIPFNTAWKGELTNVVNGQGQFNITFKDAYGTVNVIGNFNQSATTGKINFVNSRHFNNETPKSGSLGTMSMKTCGLFI